MLTRRYRIEKEIGHGSFAVIMKAFDRVRQIPVAIKKFDIRGPLSLQLIRQEAYILSMLNHPTIVKMYEKIEEDSNVFIVMEYIDGQDLLKYLNSSNGGLSEKESAELFAQMVSGLKYIHSLKIMHRDLKIENFMVTKDGRIKFIDFGCSKNTSASTNSDMFTTMCGSFAYCSPERIASMPYSFEADVWSLGIILYAMVECRLPFKSDDDTEILGINIVKKEPNYPSNMSEKLIDLLRNILVKNPKLRITIDQITEHPFVREEYLTWARTHADEHNKNINFQPVLRSTGGLKTLIDFTCKATTNLDDNLYVSPLVPYCSSNCNISNDNNNFKLNNIINISNKEINDYKVNNDEIGDDFDHKENEKIDKYELLKNVPFISDFINESSTNRTSNSNFINSGFANNDCLGVNIKEKNASNGRYKFRNRSSKIDDNDTNRIQYKRNIKVKTNNNNNVRLDKINVNTIVSNVNNNVDESVANNININNNIGGTNHTEGRKQRVFIPLKAANVKFDKTVPM